MVGKRSKHFASLLGVLTVTGGCGANYRYVPIGDSMSAPLASVSATTAPRHICWIDRVLKDQDGVKVFYVRNGPISIAAGPVSAKVGEILAPMQNGHDGCYIEVQRRDGKVGLLAKSFFFASGIMREPEQSEEWIEATLSNR